MCRALVMATPHSTKSFIMDCNALRQVIGVVLMQEGRPLSFEIHQIKGRDVLKPIYEKEMLAILHTIKQ